MRVNKCKTCQTCHDLDCSWGLSEWTEKLGGVWTQCPPSPALPSPYIVLIIIRIQCVLVQYITVVIGMLCTAFHIDLTQLNGIPCPICSESFILILYWKGIVNTVWRREKRGEGRRRGENKREKKKKEAGSSLLLFSPPLFPSFLSLSLSPSFPLMSVLSIGSWTGGYHIPTYIILRTRRYIFSHSVTHLCALVSPIGSGGGPAVLSEALKMLVFTMWWRRKVLFEMI